MRALVAALMIAVAGPAAAQQSPATCQDSWDMLARAMPIAVSAEIAAEGPLCVARNVEANESFAQILIDRITWEGQGLDRFAEEGIPPRSLMLAVERARTVRLTGDLRTDYVRRAQALNEAVSGRLEMRWDQLTNRLFLDALNLDFPGENGLRMSAQAGGVDLSSMSTLRTSLGSAVLASMTVDVTTFGLFETYLLERLVLTAMAPDEDPAISMPGLVADLSRQIEALPDSSFTAETRAEMITFLEDLPSPRGDLRISVTADPPFGWIRLVPNWLNSGGVRNPETLLDGVRIRFEYTPRPPAQ